LAPVLLICSVTILLFIVDIATEAFPANYTLAQHMDNSIGAVTHFIVMSLCVFPAAMVSRKFDSIMDTVNALRPLKSQGKLQNPAESEMLSNAEITSFLIYLSTSKVGVEILGIKADLGILTFGYYVLISVVVLTFKMKFEYITKNL